MINASAIHKSQPIKRSKKNVVIEPSPWQQVGKTKVTNANGKPGFLKYSQIPITDSEQEAERGWVLDPLYKPITGDLMYLKRKDKVNIVNGWWDGHKWVGLRLRHGDIITAWKRNLIDDRALY